MQVPALIARRIQSSILSHHLHRRCDWNQARNVAAAAATVRRQWRPLSNTTVSSVLSDGSNSAGNTFSKESDTDEAGLTPTYRATGKAALHTPAGITEPMSRASDGTIRNRGGIFGSPIRKIATREVLYQDQLNNWEGIDSNDSTGLDKQMTRLAESELKAKHDRFRHREDSSMDYRQPKNPVRRVIGNRFIERKHVNGRGWKIEEVEIADLKVIHQRRKLQGPPRFLQVDWGTVEVKNELGWERGQFEDEMSMEDPDAVRIGTGRVWKGNGPAGFIDTNIEVGVMRIWLDDEETDCD